MTRTAIVTGGSRGIGYAISRELAAAGNRIVITCQKDLARAEAAAEEIRGSGGEAHAIVADVREPAAVKALADRVAKDFGGADILINNAGIIKDALFPFEGGGLGRGLEIDPAAPSVRPSRSRDAARRGEDRQYRLGQRHLNTSPTITRCKGASSLTKALALEMATHGITVNAVASARGYGDHHHLEGGAAPGVPPPHLKPEEISAVVGSWFRKKPPRDGQVCVWMGDGVTGGRDGVTGRHDHSYDRPLPSPTL
jgi:3-oxoacyl-[acyl-carrier protein] reductase